MIINIPLQIDDAAIEGELTKEYRYAVLNAVEKRVDEALKAYDDGKSYAYSYGHNSFNSASAEKGLGNIIGQIVDKHVIEFFEANNDAIIEQAANILAAKLSRTKKGKAILDELEVSK